MTGAFRIGLWALLAGLCGCALQSPAPVVDRSAQRTASGGVHVVRAKDTLYSIAFRHELDYRALAAANGIAEPYLIKPGQRIRLAASPSAAPAAPTMPTAPSVAQAPVGASVSAPPRARPLAQNKPVVAAPIARPAAAVRRQAPTSTNPSAPSVAKKPPATPPARLPPAAPAAPPAPAEPPAAPRASPPVRPAPAAAPPASGWRKPVDAKPVRGFGGGSKGYDYQLPPATRVHAASAGVVVYAGPGLGGFRHLVIVKASDSHLVAYGVNVKPLLAEGDPVRAGTAIAEIRGDDKTAGRFHFEIRSAGKPIDPGPLIGA